MKNVHSNVLYCEPNDLFNYDPNGKNISLAPDLEDYCITVDLEVEIPGHMKSSKVKDGNGVIVMRWVNGTKSGDNKISFLQGTRYTYEGSKGRSFLTTAAYDFATYDDVWKTQDPNGDGNVINSTNELFGINSIDIEYNNYMVPIVTINFTDIRGISLFAPEEIRHRMTYVNGDSATSGFADKDIAGSFFKSFFTFPYPKFRLSVKGFYGEPTTYELSCSDFRARFDSETGNFGATAKFVGYSYSLLGDVTLSALVAAPYEASCGKGYWLEKVDEGVFVFDDGKPMVTLLEILTKSNDIMINLDKLSKTDPIYDNLKNYDDNSKLLAEIEVSFSDYVSSILNTNTPIEGSIKSNADTNQTYYFKIEGDIIDNNTINTKKQSLEEKIKKYPKFASRYSSIDFIDKEEGVSIFNASEFYGALVQEKNNIAQNIEDANKEVGVKSRQIIGDVLGFSPTVENITNVLLAHLETFLRCIYRTTEQVSGRTPQSTGVYTHGFNIEPNEVLPPFPKYTTVVSKNYHNINREEDGWIGDLENKLVEQELIEGLLKGIEDIESILDKVTESFENFKQSNMAVKIPTTITDLLIEDGPFKGDLNEGNIEDLFGRLAARMSLILGLNGKSEADSNLAKTLGKADAHNFFISHPNIGEKLLTPMKSGTIGNDAWESLNKQHINENVVWEREGSDLPWFIGSHQINRLYVNGHTALRLDGFYWEELRKDIEGKGYIEHIDHYIIDRDIKTSPINNPNILNILNEGELNNLLTKVQVLQEGDWRDIANSKMFTSLINWDIGNYETTYLKHNFKNTLKGKFIQEVESETTLYPSILPTNTNVKNISYNPTNVIIEKDNKIKVVIKGKDGNELKQPWVDLDGRLHNPRGKTRDKKVKITDKDSGYTIWSFERNGKCLFGDPIFYTYNKYIQGLLFLDQWNWGQSISKFLKGSVNIDILPKYAVLYMGGCLYALKEGKDLKNLDLKATVTTITTSSSLLGPIKHEEITDVLTPISSLRSDVQSILINYFKEWVEKDNGYTLIHGTYAFDDGDDVKSLKTFFAEDKGHEDVISDLKEIWPEEKINKLLKAYLTVVSRTEELRLINRNSSLIDSIIEDAQSPCALIHPILDVTNSDHTFAVNQGCAKKYLEGFQSEIKTLYEGLENSTSEDATSSTNDQKDIKIALYNYIKILWDRWLSGDAEGWKTWGLVNFKKHWYYIDSYYNDIGQDNFINLESFMKDITSSLKTQGYSLLSYLFTMYARERFNLFCVQNFLGMVNEEKMKRMFDPIPFNEVAFNDKTYIPDFVAMYTGEFSNKLDMEDANQVGDSYLIATEKYEELPIAIREKVIGKNGHRIPAFGVSFGRQYQHYFKTYEISMDSPVVTEQALKAKFMLANINSSDNSGESGRNAIHISPDLYTIYSNNSYSCNIQMMGCAWIQPLMYFQLNNVPMFRGTYLIQKVTHRIVPGDMTTTFMGTRMAKTTTPIVKEPIASKNASQTEPFTEDAKKNKEYENASINNDCEYKFFALNVTDGGIDDELLYQTATSVSPQHLGTHEYSNLYYSKCSLLDVLAASAYGAVGGGNKLAVQLTATVHYNRYMKCGDFDSSQFFVHNQIEFDTNLALDFLGMDESSETRKNVTEWVKEIYSSSPVVLVGQSTTVQNKSITLKGNDANIQTKSKVLTLSDLQRMNGYATAEENGYFAWMNGAGGVDPSKIHYVCQHEWDEIWSHVFVSFNNNETLWNKSNTKTNSTRSYDDIMSQLYSSIQSTMLYSSNIKADANNVLTYSKVSDGVYDLKDKSSTQASSVLAQVYDIVINAYSDYVKNAYWVVSNESPLDSPYRVRVELGIGSNIHTFAMTTFKNSEPNIIREFRYWTDDKGDSAWDINPDFCKCLQKKYDSITETNIVEFVKDCPNFSYYLTKHEEIEEAVKEINSILNKEFKSCDELMETIGNAPSEGFSWMGHTDNSLYELTPQKNKSNSYDENRVIEYLQKHEQPRGGHCAEYVRRALQYVGINCNVRPNSACCYEKFLPVWGFDLVATLEKGQPIPPSFILKKGDIAVSQSSPSHKYGHIQIYDTETNKWWADVPYNNADPYSEWGRLTNIYRWPGL